LNRLLVIGAGATIEECIRSGNFPNDPQKLFPTTKNFCNKFFNPLSSSLLAATASYLDAHGIPFETKLLNIKDGNRIPFDISILNINDGDKISDEDLEKCPIGVFKRMESQNPEIFNIEKLSEFAWGIVGSDQAFWRDFVKSGIYDNLMWLFLYQFGSGKGNPMLAGTKVAAQLRPNDLVINLNYDIAFDLALKQIGKDICYAPQKRNNNILVIKPHGSINCYINHKNGNYYFTEPDKIAGSVSIDRGDDGIFDPFGSLFPPRLNKNYKMHPMAKAILETAQPYNVHIVTFWGVGLTESDIDLLSIYKKATKKAQTIEFINPDKRAYQKAMKLLKKEIEWFSNLDQWVSKYENTTTKTSSDNKSQPNH